MGFVTDVTVKTKGADQKKNPIGSALYGTCATSKRDTEKQVAMSFIDNLRDGMTIHVKFYDTNTASNPTLKVADQDAKPILRYTGTAPGDTPNTSWSPGAVIAFTYDPEDGGVWRMNNTQDSTELVNSISDVSADVSELQQAAESMSNDISHIQEEMSESIDVDITSSEVITYVFFLNPCIITFDSNGGLPLDVMYVETGTIVEEVYFPIATREGYLFLGWFEEVSEGEKITSITVEHDITLYAHWEEIQESESEPDSGS